jgi:hypothetical protein
VEGLMGEANASLATAGLLPIGIMQPVQAKLMARVTPHFIMWIFSDWK